MAGVGQNDVSTDIDNSFVAEAPSDKGSEGSGRDGKEKAAGTYDSSHRHEDGNYQDGNDGHCHPTRGNLLWFNRATYVICFTVFLYLTSEVVSDYMRQRSDEPLTGLTIKNDPLQLFPGIIICNFAHGLDITNLTSALLSEWTDRLQEITHYWKPLHCGSDCWQLRTPLKAFDTDPSTGRCIEKNIISMTFNINIDRYPSTKQVGGVYGVLHNQGGESESFADFWCSNRTGSCGSAGDSDQSCFSNYGNLSYSEFYASSGMGTTVTLKRKEVQEGIASCNLFALSWSPMHIPFTLNKRFVESMNFTDPDSVVSIRFNFRDPLIETVTYQPMSAATMFGSVAGWFGFLSDGWGIITLLHMIEMHFWPSLMLGAKAVDYAKQAASRMKST